MSELSQVIKGIELGKLGQSPTGSNYYLDKGIENGALLRQKLLEEVARKQILSTPVLNPNSINYLNQLKESKTPAEMPFFYIKE